MRCITQLRTAIALGAAVVAASATSLAGQDRLAATWPSSSNATAQSRIDKGNELLGEHQYRAARSEYEAAVELILADGDFPNTAMYSIAASYYYEGKPMTAAGRLDELAAEAALYGDVVTQVWAVADAAWIYGRTAAKIDMDSRVERLRRLLKSPYLPEGVLNEVMSKRLGEATTLILQ